MSISAFQRKLEMLVSLDAVDRRTIAALPITVYPTEKRREIFDNGQRPNFAFVLLEGWAARFTLRTDGSRRITGFLLPGDFCGIHARCGAEMDHAVVAITDCRVGHIPHDVLNAAIKDRRNLSDALWRAKLSEEATLRKWLLVSHDAYVAVAHFLCELHERSERLGLVRDGRSKLPLTQTDIGDALSLTAVHVNRTLQRLRRDGLIVIGKGELTLVDGTALKRAAAFKPDYLGSWRQ